MPEVGQALSHFRILEKIGNEGVIHRDLRLNGTVPHSGAVWVSNGRLCSSPG